MKKTQDKVAASVTVYQVADMTTKGRAEVCGWLRKLADDLQREPESFAKTFRARYLYSPNNAIRRRSPAIIFRCLFCGREFITVEACNACEETHKAP